MRGGHDPARCASVSGRLFWGLYTPGWPSAAFDRFVDGELARLQDPGSSGLRALILCVTRQCPLRCAHCCEWPDRDRADRLTTDDLCAIVGAFQQRGVCQVFLSGGEPLEREAALLSVVERGRAVSDLWLLTSGWGMTPEAARRLRRAGLTGVVVSLDHEEEAFHDAFRGREGSFAWACRAAQNARDAGLVLALALCLRPELASLRSLVGYASLGARLGAHFIELLEPMPVGRWAGGAPVLAAEQRLVVEQFAVALNAGELGPGLPLAAHPAGLQRRSECFGGGRRYAYVDADGQLHPCAFCRRASGTVTAGGLDEALTALRQAGCGAGFPAGA